MGSPATAWRAIASAPSLASGIDVQHQEFVAAHAAGQVPARIDGARAALLIESRSDVPLTIGEGYRWQRLNFLSCLACGLPLLLGAPWWLCLGLAAMGLVLREWGIAIGAVFAALVVWYGEYLGLTGWLCLAISLLYLWQMLRAARRDLVRMALAEPATFHAAVARGALRLHPLRAG
jgi:hypothetical protein